MMESRHIGVWRQVSECEEPRCAEGPGRPWSALADADSAVYDWLGPGNTNIQLYGDRLGTTRYTTPPGTQPMHHPGYPPVPVRAMHSTGASAVTAVYGSTKEILGVNNAPDI